MPFVQLINPNTTQATTDMMVETARATAPAGLSIEGLTARHGMPLIVDEDGLKAAAVAVLDLAAEVTADGVVVAAFGDPGADALRGRLAVPVIGIGEASMRAAASSGRRFAIATTTPGLVVAIQRRVDSLGLFHQFAGVRVTAGDPAALTADPAALDHALSRLVQRCRDEDGADAVIIGGGPLARAARSIAGRAAVAIIEPVPAAIAWMQRSLGIAGPLE